MSTEDPAATLLNELSVAIYEPSFAQVRRRLQQLPGVLRTVVLVIDFDTELAMQGILGFLENSTGQFLPETISAFEVIGAEQTARTLAAIADIMQSAGANHEALRCDLTALQPWEVTSFRRAHTRLDERVLKAVRELELGFYLHDQDAERAMSLLEKYVAANLTELRSQLARLSDPLA